MSTMRHLAVMLLACGLVFLVTGCSGDDVDESKSVGDVKKDIEKMDTGDLRAEANKYKEAIEAKLAEVAKLKDKIPTDPTKLLSEDTKTLKSDIETLEKAIKPLKEKLQACIDKLKKEGEDVSDLEVK